MGLQSELLADIKEAFDDDLSDAVKLFTLTHYDRDSNVYDAATSNVTRSSTDYSSRGVFDSYTQQERFNTHIEATDIKLIVLANEIDIEPKIRDTVTQTLSGKEFRVKSVSKDPVDAIYELQIESIDS